MATSLDLLPPQQKRIAKLVSYGIGNAEIAEALGTSEGTVGNQLTRIYDRLDIDCSMNRRVVLARQVILQGIEGYCEKQTNCDST